MKPSLINSGNAAKAFENIIDKTSYLLNCHYNIDLKFVRKEIVEKESLFKLQVIENNLFIYPVNFAGAFQGLIEIHCSKKLSLVEINKVRNILSLCVKSASQYFERTVLLQQLENHLKLQIAPKASKVIDFSNFKKNRKIVSLHEDISTSDIIQAHPPIFIEGQDHQDIRKLALELHYFLKHKSFVNFVDIANNINHIEDILALQESTIYIDEIHRLSFTHKILLLDYFTEFHSEGYPLIISSSQQKYNMLINNSLNRTLLKFLSTYHVRLTKPFSEIKKNGLTTFLTNLLRDPKFFDDSH